MNLKNYFSKKLLRWYHQNPRTLPWKQTRDPYKIWLSEIILQQTRVEQGTPYYERLVGLFPTVHDLAKANEDEVMKAWEGLGYYTRARNLHAASRQIVNDFSGIFPSSHNEILQLKGVGSYTAAAIASFAFDLPHAVVDGNVYRVLARIFGIAEAVDSPEGRKIFLNLAEELLDKKNPADHNQAIMNFGALVCRPANPLCEVCCFRKECFAFNNQMIDELPRKDKKISVRIRWLNFVVLEDGSNVIIEKRKEDDIWKSLFQFPVIETKTFSSAGEIVKSFMLKNIKEKINLKITGVSPVIEHKLTHQKIMAQFIRVSVSYTDIMIPAKWRSVRKTDLKNFGLPKLIVNYYEKLLH